ncbi:MAG TPA: cytochrome c maturation protein CcmE [bacterium]|nr:cytochrome c maturation protein CcmE [bacterium]
MRRRPGHYPLVFAGGAALLVLSLAYLVYGGIQEGAAYWVTVGELQQQRMLPQRAAEERPSRVRLGGTVALGSVQWDSSHRHLRFMITDGAHALPVAYSGVVPDIFKDGRQVVVEGTLGRDGTFQATTLLAKCPTKYSPRG